MRQAFCGHSRLVVWWWHDLWDTVSLDGKNYNTFDIDRAFQDTFGMFFLLSKC